MAEGYYAGYGQQAPYGSPYPGQYAGASPSAGGPAYPQSAWPSFTNPPQQNPDGMPNLAPYGPSSPPAHFGFPPSGYGSPSGEPGGFAAPFPDNNQPGASYYEPSQSGAPYYDPSVYSMQPRESMVTTTVSTYTPYPPQSPESLLSSPTSSHSTGSRARARKFSERPRAWRPDFSMRGPGLVSLLPSLPRRNSTPAHMPNLVLNDRVRYNALRDPPVVHDLRHDPSRVQIRELKRPVTNYDLTRYITEPPCAYLKLYHPRLPWYIEINTPGQAGATLYDLFITFYTFLLSRVKDHDLYNFEVLNEDRQKITTAWRERCQYDSEAMSQGVKKVDFMRGDCVFIGLAKGRDGMFEIKTKKVY
ncbi:hypothetical protein BV25DRAFT_810434 [Artomyces pyxidatus]|uniref:Uncharacterized protein n=1 Tax=Artomyces pyxidatus TaxID=48021 RepID=A0ACB8SCU4_9AGAM|nr:hypothetical protein BV25DRAFT_810434 [Artomyces pyxidatus]